jgi:hypothetical protein
VKGLEKCRPDALIPFPFIPLLPHLTLNFGTTLFTQKKRKLVNEREFKGDLKKIFIASHKIPMLI